MKRILVAIIAFFTLGMILALMLGCNTETPQENWDPSKPIETKVGKKFELTFEANHTTGYQWQLAQPLDESILKLVSSKYEAPTTSRVGAGGKEVWTFKATGKGQTEIYMEYIRPWEEGVPPAKSGTLSVIVK